jgi:hypothetical protein
MSLKNIAALCNMPNLAKMSKVKAVEKAEAILAARALFKLEQMIAPKVAPAKPAKKPKAVAAKDAPAGAPVAKVPSKANRLVDALRVGGDRDMLIEASGFDNKNLSVSMSLLKRAGYVIGVQIIPATADTASFRFYQLVEDARTAAH